MVTKRRKSEEQKEKVDTKERKGVTFPLCTVHTTHRKIVKPGGEVLKSERHITTTPHVALFILSFPLFSFTHPLPLSTHTLPYHPPTPTPTLVPTTRAMRPHQKFRLGFQVESIAVRQGANGKYYSELTDIQDTFPNASRFKVDGVTLIYLQDENGRR
jgi:hypothetical protein